MWSKRWDRRAIQRFVAGNVDPDRHADKGYLRATCGSSIDLFAGLGTPIVERFEPADEFVNSMVSPVAETLSRIIHVAAEFI